MDVHVARRARLAERIRANGGGVAVLLTAPEAVRNRDSHYPYRWDSYFYYLTGFPEPEAAMVISVDAAGASSELFCREKDREREIWDGFRYGPEAARQTFGFDAAHPFAALDARMGELLCDRPAVYYPLCADGDTDARVARWLCAVRAKARSGIAAPAQAIDLRALLDEMRLVKDAHEVSVMRRAGEIAAGAHVRAMRSCEPGMHEYQVEAELLHEFRRHGSQFPAYGSIVAGGRNACVLHYNENSAQLRDGDLLLIDAGCELDGYASDITRTFPVNGRFSTAQREIYEIVLAAQAAAIGAIAPGARFIEAHDAAVRVLTQGMIDCGLLQGTLDGAIESGAYKRFYMHRTGHWIGMDVHDCGEYREPDAPGVGEQRPWRVLRPGMALTVEPGLYVQAADDVPERYHDIGVRIEDDALVATDGCELLTAGVPKTVDEIEALMRD